MRDKKPGEKPKQVINEYVEQRPVSSRQPKVSKPKYKKPVYKRPWFIVLMVLLAVGIVGATISPDDEYKLCCRQRHTVRRM